MFFPHCCFPGVVQDCDEASLLSDMKTGFADQRDSASPLSLVWGEDTLRPFSSFESSSELASTLLAAREGGTQFAHPLLR